MLYPQCECEICSSQALVILAGCNTSYCTYMHCLMGFMFLTFLNESW